MEEILRRFKKLSPYDPIFVENKDALSYLQDLNILRKKLTCVLCSSTMNVKKSSRSSDGVVFKCEKKKCKKILSIKSGSKLSGLNIPTYLILRCVYAWTLNYSNYQATHLSDISEPTFIKVKDRIPEWLEVDTEEMIGGVGVEVQIDETAICNGAIITNPSSAYDNTPNTQWLIGGIENNESQSFFLELVENRKSSTILELLKRRVKEGTIIVTDGYPSYPSAVRLFGAVHHVVNHTEGFVNADGMHTNLIENLWGHLKQEYRSRNGVNKERMQYFLIEFEWKKKNLTYSEKESIRIAWCKILYSLKINPID